MTYIGIRIALTAAVIGALFGAMMGRQDDARVAKFFAVAGNLAIWTAVISALISIWRYF
jgi:phosphate/sulfate permease